MRSLSKRWFCLAPFLIGVQLLAQSYKCYPSSSLYSDEPPWGCSSYPTSPGTTRDETMTWDVYYAMDQRQTYPSYTQHGLCITVASCTSPYTQVHGCAPQFGSPVTGLGTWQETSSSSTISSETQNCSNSPPAPATAPIGFCATDGGPTTISSNDPTCSGTPIVVDPYGEGFHLTNEQAGVQFRLFAEESPRQMSWTAASWHNGWLALDRNGNGTIDDFSELFGNLTPQPESAEPNGFAALAVFDDPANGGNGNGYIDPGDSVYSHLRVWIDANHNGVSELQELHTLTDLGIFRIDLTFTLSGRTDQYGNHFRYKGTLADRFGDTPQVCYDVVLLVGSEGVQ